MANTKIFGIIAAVLAAIGGGTYLLKSEGADPAPKPAPVAEVAPAPAPEPVVVAKAEVEAEEPDPVIEAPDPVIEAPAPVVEAPVAEAPAVEAPVVAEPVAEEPVVEAPVVAETPVEVVEDAPATEDVVAEAEPALEEPEEKAPEFDVVRVENDGSALLAGRAEPNSTVTITSDGEEIASVETDAQGQFVAFANAPATGAPQELRVEGDNEASSDPVIVLVEEPEVAEEEPAAPVVIKDTGDDIEVLQPAPKVEPAQVTLDVISYDEDGALALEGRAAYGYVVRVYLDGGLIGVGDVLQDGGWGIVADEIIPGIYTMRVDETDIAGKVRSRLEVPFKREAPTPELAEEVRQNRIVVQPGNNLWTIAKDRYGQGLAYWTIFNANADAIRDPNLIYPGQVFTLPEGVEVQ